MRSYILDIKKDKKSGAKGKKGVAKERVKDARLELVWVSRALLIDPTLLGNFFFFLKSIFIQRY